MSPIEELEAKIRQRLAVAAERQQVHRQHVEERMRAVERAQVRQEEIASRATDLFDAIVRPRVDVLAAQFDNAAPFGAAADGNCCGLRFQHTSSHPATVTLELSAHLSLADSRIVLEYRLEILPSFFDYENRDELIVDADQRCEGAAAEWVDRKLLGFLDSYLGLQELDPYQMENLVTDPVCGMRFNRTSAAAEAEYRGRRYYFCVTACHELFLKDPAEFVSMPE